MGKGGAGRRGRRGRGKGRDQDSITSTARLGGQRSPQKVGAVSKETVLEGARKLGAGRARGALPYERFTARLPSLHPHLWEGGL